jgi:Predicted membrane protein
VSDDVDRPPLGPRRTVVTYLKGAAMGAADAVPGVSGGTIALLVGVYERLVSAVASVTPGAVAGVLALPLPGRRRAAVAAFRGFDGPFLAALGAGVLTAVVVVTRVLGPLIDSRPVPTFGLFFGLIGASALVLAADVSLETPGQAGAMVAGAVAGFVLSGEGSAALPAGPATTVLAGSVAVSAMILPGVSGSLLLLVLRQYERMVDTLRRFVDALVAAPRAGLGPVVEPGTTVALFVTGAVVGLFTVAHGVRLALDRRPEATLAALLGLVVGALRAPVVRAGLDGSSGDVGAFAAAALAGVVVVVALDRLT